MSRNGVPSTVPSLCTTRMVPPFSTTNRRVSVPPALPIVTGRVRRVANWVSVMSTACATGAAVATRSAAPSPRATSTHPYPANALIRTPPFASPAPCPSYITVSAASVTVFAPAPAAFLCNAVPACSCRSPMTWRLVQLVRQPADDYLNALGLFLSGWRWSRAPILALAAGLTWWVYVPLHELAHAFGCMVGGGTVSRLDIDPLYGAALLQRVFPFVAVGSDYAGQLTGFDTRGSDLTYLLTDFLPFIATIIVGVPLLQAVGRPGWSSAAQAALFG